VAHKKHFIYFQKVKTDPGKNVGYNKRLQPFAHQLRGTMTKAEASLWKYGLRARGIKGYQFRRERPVLNYIADFMCKELKLVIEVDGFTHQLEETYIKDKKKDEDLKNAGFTVLRFSDNEVLQSLPFVIKAIEIAIEELEKKQATQP
jgi:very-short-patch-repair endonuclease